MYKEPLFNMLSVVFSKIAPVLRRDFEEMQHVSNKDKFFAAMLNNLSMVLLEQLEKPNLRNGIIINDLSIPVLKTSLNGVYWVIRLVDSKENFFNNFPFFGPVIALIDDLPTTSCQLAAFYDPLRNDMFCAKKGIGAFCNGRKMRVKLGHGLTSGIGGQRNLGSAAIQFSYFAMNKLSRVKIVENDIATLGFCELIAKESNGFFYKGKEIVASREEIAELSKTIEKN